MAMWHCPHCGAPQAETARCWVCRRSSTTCSTCRHFRASLAADVGYCGLDRRRAPLTGRELRACWTQPAAPEPTPGVTPGVQRRISVREPTEPLRGFVPLDTVDSPGPPETVADPPIAMIDPPAEGWDARTSLFGEIDR